MFLEYIAIFTSHLCYPEYATATTQVFARKDKFIVPLEICLDQSSSNFKLYLYSLIEIIIMVTFFFILIHLIIMVFNTTLRVYIGVEYYTMRYHSHPFELRESGLTNHQLIFDNKESILGLIQYLSTD